MSTSKGTIYTKDYQVHTGKHFIIIFYKNDLLLTVKNTFWADERGHVYSLKKFLHHPSTTYTWSGHDHGKELRYYLALFKKLSVIHVSGRPHLIRTIPELTYRLYQRLYGGSNFSLPYT